MKRINVAIIGCGAVAEVNHLPALQRMPEYQVKYLVDVSESRVNRLKDKLKSNCTATTDYKDALNDEEVEAVMILTPPSLHRKMVLESAEAGKHVFCEKPFAMNSQEADEMVKACLNGGVKLMVGFNNRFIPQFKKIKEMIDHGFFGHIIGGHSTMFANAFEWPSVSKFQYDKAGGGGALFEMGAHHVDLMNWCFGEATLVTAKISTLSNQKIDDTASVYTQYQNGGSSIVFTGWNGLSVNSITIIGTDGYANAFSNRNEVLYFRKDLVGQAPIRIKVSKGLPPYQEEMLHFCDCIRKNKTPIMTSQEIINSVRVVEAAYRSNDIGQPVSLSDLYV